LRGISNTRNGERAPPSQKVLTPSDDTIFARFRGNFLTAVKTNIKG
jgi:hypothetical protein